MRAEDSSGWLHRNMELSLATPQPLEAVLLELGSASGLKTGGQRGSKQHCNNCLFNAPIQPPVLNLFGQLSLVPHGSVLYSLFRTHPLAPMGSQDSLGRGD
jgi:hypothetical protein